MPQLAIVFKFRVGSLPSLGRPILSKKRPKTLREDGHK